MSTTGRHRSGPGRVRRRALNGRRVTLGIVACGPGTPQARAGSPRRTIDGATPKTSRIRSADRTSAAAPSATMPPAVKQDQPWEERGGQAEIVEHGQDRDAIADVEVHEQFHGRDLVTKVQVDRRLVEDQDRRGLGDGERDEHQLPFAERQFADVPAAADARSRRARWPRPRPRGRPAGRRAAGPRAAGGRARRAASTEVEKGTLTCCGTTAIRRAIVARSSPRSGIAGDPHLAAARRDQPGDDPEQGRLAGAVRPDQRDALAGRDRQVDAGDDGPAAVGDRDVVELDHSS